MYTEECTKEGTEWIPSILEIKAEKPLPKNKFSNLRQMSSLSSSKQRILISTTAFNPLKFFNFSDLRRDTNIIFTL